MDLVKPLNFDSSYNLLVVRTLLQDGVYGTDNYIPPGELRYTTDTRSILTNTPYPIDYSTTPNKIYLFDTWITTGFPVIIPTYIASLLFGFNYFVPRLVMNVFAIAFIFLLWRSLIKMLNISSHRVDLLLLIISMSFIFDLDEYMVHTLGEIPAFVFLLFAYHVNKKSPFISGIMLSFSFLTKSIFIYVCLPYFILSLWEYLKNRSFKQSLLYILGFIVPIAIWVFWITRYYGLIEYARLLSETLQKQIVPFHYLHLINPAYLATKITSYITFDSFSFMLMVSFIALLLRYPKMRSKESLSISVIFGYFIFVYSENITRHIVLFSYFLSLLFIVMLAIYAAPKIIKSDYYQIKYLALILAILALFILFPSLKTHSDFLVQKKIAYFITSKHPNDTFFFYNWWKAPGIQILAKKNFIFMHPNTLQFCKNKCYLIIESDFKKLDIKEYNLMVNGFPSPTFSISSYDFYELNLR